MYDQNRNEHDQRTITTTRTVANGLGWFSIGLGVFEIFAAKPIAKALGLKSTALIRIFGVREIAAGLGILTQQKKGPGIWARVVGDVLDAAVLGTALLPGKRKRRNAALAAAAVSPVIVADIVCGKRLGFAGNSVGMVGETAGRVE